MPGEGRCCRILATVGYFTVQRCRLMQEQDCSHCYLQKSRAGTWECLDQPRPSVLIVEGVENRSYLQCSEHPELIGAPMLTMCRTQQPSHVIPADVLKKRCTFPSAAPRLQLWPLPTFLLAEPRCARAHARPVNERACVGSLCRPLAGGREVSQFQRRTGMKRRFMHHWMSWSGSLIKRTQSCISGAFLSSNKASWLMALTFGTHIQWKSQVFHDNLFLSLAGSQCSLACTSQRQEMSSADKNKGLIRFQCLWQVIKKENSTCLSTKFVMFEVWNFTKLLPKQH